MARNKREKHKIDLFGGEYLESKQCKETEIGRHRYIIIGFLLKKKKKIIENLYTKYKSLHLYGVNKTQNAWHYLQPIPTPPEVPQKLVLGNFNSTIYSQTRQIKHSDKKE